MSPPPPSSPNLSCPLPGRCRRGRTGRGGAPPQTWSEPGPAATAPAGCRGPRVRHPRPAAKENVAESGTAGGMIMCRHAAPGSVPAVLCSTEYPSPAAQTCCKGHTRCPQSTAVLTCSAVFIRFRPCAGRSWWAPTGAAQQGCTQQLSVGAEAWLQTPSVPRGDRGHRPAK